jgi:hypothetical protein
VSGNTINSGGAENTMGGGRGKLMRISTCAIVGTGTTTANAKSVTPKSNFFILLPPLSFTVAILVKIAFFISLLLCKNNDLRIAFTNALPTAGQICALR